MNKADSQRAPGGGGVSRKRPRGAPERASGPGAAPDQRAHHQPGGAFVRRGAAPHQVIPGLLDEKCSMPIRGKCCLRQGTTRRSVAMSIPAPSSLATPSDRDRGRPEPGARGGCPPTDGWLASESCATAHLDNAHLPPAAANPNSQHGAPRSLPAPVGFGHDAAGWCGVDGRSEHYLCVWYVSDSYAVALPKPAA